MRLDELARCGKCLRPFRHGKEPYDVDLTIEKFDQCRASFHPIAAVVVRDSADLPDCCAMDVSTQHRVHRVPLRVMYDCFLKFADETYRILYSLFGVSAQRPVAEPETAPDEIDQWIER